MTICDQIQERLAVDGDTAVLADDTARAHIEGCADCTSFLTALHDIETDLRQAPSFDASDDLVAATLLAVRDAPAPSRQPVGPKQRWMFRAAAASIMVIASGTLIHSIVMSPEYNRVFGPPATEQVYDDSRPHLKQTFENTPDAAVVTGNARGVVADKKAKTQVAEAPQSRVGAVREATRRDYREDSLGTLMAAPEDAPRQPSAVEADPNRQNEIIVAEGNAGVGGGRRIVPTEEAGRDRMISGGSARNRQLLASRDAEFDDIGVESESEISRLRKSEARALSPARPTSEGAQESQTMPVLRGQIATEQFKEDLIIDQALPATAPEPPPAKDDNAGDDPRFAQFAGRSGEPATTADNREREIAASSNKSNDLGDRSESAADGDTGDAFALLQAPPPVNAPVGGLTLSDEMAGEYRFAPNRSTSKPDPDLALAAAQDFLTRYKSLAGLRFVPAVGYWSNSYIPGDPAMRLLANRLQGWNRHAFGPDRAFDQTVRTPAQPFDAPRDAALAVYLNSDVSAVQGPTRLRVQVGLRGADRKGGRRPAMNIGVLVDATAGNDFAFQTNLRALLVALSDAWQPGDRFSLTASGPDGGTLVAPGPFGHGSVQVALDRLFAGRRPSGVNDIGIDDALALAGQAVRAHDEATAVLGSSLILLVTGSSIDGDLAALAAIAHQNAVDGISLSAVQVGPGANPDQIDRLVAAGQGHRRVLEAAAAAASLVDRELHAASRAVARAVRLRIQLAPGVKLVDVLGADRLDDPAADRVRAAEVSIDQRMARNLGIKADRGEDENGVQIVIPHFYAGDSHVVLLDVVATRAGPVADVTVRYKDLVTLGNGVARAGLALPSGDDRPGPLHRQVQKNHWSWYLTATLRRAGSALDQGNLPGARATIAELRAVVAGLRRSVPGWDSDADLAADQAMLDDYLAALGNPISAHDMQRNYLAESLRYAAFRKTHAATE